MNQALFGNLFSSLSVPETGDKVIIARPLRTVFRTPLAKTPAPLGVSGVVGLQGVCTLSETDVSLLRSSADLFRSRDILYALWMSSKKTTVRSNAIYYGYAAVQRDCERRVGEFLEWGMLLNFGAPAWGFK